MKDLRFQLTRPVWGEPTLENHRKRTRTISTHSPRVGRTPYESDDIGLVRPFQLTRPVWGEPGVGVVFEHAQRISTHSPRVGRTLISILGYQSCLISTHSPRVGRTITLLRFRKSGSNFNSLAPCGANLLVLKFRTIMYSFQLTRPVWGEPAFTRFFTDTIPISTHSPRVGRTNYYSKHSDKTYHFNSLAPCGANLDVEVHVPPVSPFQLTRPVWGEPRNE